MKRSLWALVLLILVLSFQNFDVVPNLSHTVELPLGLKAADLKLPLGEQLDPSLAELGNLLFFDKRLSANNAISCASCHVPTNGYAATSFVKGVQNTQLPRTASFAMNRAFGTLQRWDGSQPSLEAQSTAPIMGAAEMGLTETQLLTVVGGVSGYANRFDRLVAAGTLPAPAISVNNIERALAVFQRSTLLSGGSRVDLYEAGQTTALTASEINGRNLFHGQARCILCHSGSNYSNESFHNIVQDGSALFKTPSLRNVALRSPYFHNGDPLLGTYATTLAIVVSRYNTAKGPDPLIIPLGLTSFQQADLVAFLNALTGPTVLNPGLSVAGVPGSPSTRENIYLSPEIFNATDYARLNPDLSGTPAQLTAHWLSQGMGQGRQGSVLFSSLEYLSLNRDVLTGALATSSPYAYAIDHYLNYGRLQGRAGRFVLTPSFFNMDDYRTLNASLKYTGYQTAMNDYLTAGKNQAVKILPSGYFQVGTNYYYSYGVYYCQYANASALETAYGAPVVFGSKSIDLGLPILPAVPPNIYPGGACEAGATFKTGDIFRASYVPGLSQMIATQIADVNYETSTGPRAIAITQAGLGFVSVSPAGTQAEANQMALEGCYALSGSKACALLATGPIFSLNATALTTAATFTYRLQNNVLPSGAVSLFSSNIPFLTYADRSALATAYASASDPRAVAVSADGTYMIVSPEGEFGTKSNSRGLGFAKNVPASLAEATRMALEQCEMMSKFMPCTLFAENESVVFNPNAINYAPVINYSQTRMTGAGPGMSAIISNSAFATGNVAITADGYGGSGATLAAAQANCAAYAKNYACFRLGANRAEFIDVHNFSAISAHNLNTHCKIMPRPTCADHAKVACQAGSFYTTHTGVVQLESCP